MYRFSRKIPSCYIRSGQILKCLRLQPPSALGLIPPMTAFQHWPPGPVRLSLSCPNSAPVRLSVPRAVSDAQNRAKIPLDAIGSSQLLSSGLPWIYRKLPCRFDMLGNLGNSGKAAADFRRSTTSRGVRPLLQLHQPANGGVVGVGSLDRLAGPIWSGNEVFLSAFPGPVLHVYN